MHEPIRAASSWDGCRFGRVTILTKHDCAKMFSNVHFGALLGSGVSITHSYRHPDFFLALDMSSPTWNASTIIITYAV